MSSCSTGRRRVREGPWKTYARMLTFRSPKHVTGPDLGVPSLTPQAYYRARFGDEAWQALGKYPREEWQDYLDWYRVTLALPVCHHTDATEIEPVGDLLRVHLAATAEGGRAGSVLARKMVLATGIEGNGDWRLPDLDLSLIPAGPLRPYELAVRRGDSSAASAWRSWAPAPPPSTRRRPCWRRGRRRWCSSCAGRTFPNVNPARWMEKSGFLRHFGDMDDLNRWRWMRILFLRSGPPTQDGINRCARFAQLPASQGHHLVRHPDGRRRAGR